jgi:hypothetical protein
MNSFSPNPAVAPALGQIAHTVGDLWAIYARLATLATAPTLDHDEVLEAIEKAAGELVRLRDRLARIATELPAPSAEVADDRDLELRPLELTRGDVECVLVDRLDPAIAAMTGISPSGEIRPSVKEARAGLQCLLADHLLLAISGLTTALRVP